jgi:hypothetical protein
MVLGRLFSFFAAPENVAVWINRLSGLSSSLTILFMFWSITMLGKKIVMARRPELSAGDKIAILGSALVGALAYTFSESFWFSAVEGEVYAMSSLFTAAIFWAILKWDEEMILFNDKKLAVNVYPDRWLLLIMFLLGLAIGVHLLGILVVPAICFVIYFRYKKEVTVKGFFLVGLLSVVILGFIQVAVIPGSIAMASAFEVTFKNSFGLPFYTGTIFFFGLLVVGSVIAVKKTRKMGNTLVYNATMGLIMLLIGYGSFAVIVIRSNANTPLDENDPENLVTLQAYLKREQYGSSPVLFGPYFNSKEAPRQEWKDRSAFYLRRFVVVKNDVDVKAFKSEKAANEYAAEVGGGAVVDEKYFESNSEDRLSQVPTYEQTTFFPRMYYYTGSPSDDAKINGYKSWSGYDARDGSGTEIGKDGERLPTFGENMTYFFRYQVNWMYIRYFMWNYAGRQNDIQGHGDQMRGNWLSGYSFIDNVRLGNQDEFAPYYTSENPSNNKFFFLPLILGLVGMFFHFYRKPKDAFVVTMVFLFTGLAIVIYLNQKPFEPRERDYAYAGSFYFFAIWIGLGVLALYDAFVSFAKKEWKKIGIISGAGLLFFLILDKNSIVSMPNTMSWLVIVGIGGGALALMYGLRKVLGSENQGALVASLLGLFIPVIMGMQGWDDHDRSDKTSARDLALNYLESCEKNGILFTNGDNDTFPLWYMQEVEGKRTDVRVCNLSLMQTDWYTDQMKMKAYDSDPLPIKFREDQILMYAGNTDQVLFIDLLDLFFNGASDESIRSIINMRLKGREALAENALTQFNSQIMNLMPNFSSGENGNLARFDLLKRALMENTGANLTDNIVAKFTASVEILSGIQTGAVKAGAQEQIQAFQKTLTDFETSWNYTNLKEAMEFVRNDANMLILEGNRTIRVFPSKGFVLPVNKENAVKSGVVKASEKDKCLNEITFEFTARGLTREQVMMLDIMANNDWKRGIYYSSPGGSDVAMALYRRRYLKQNGLAYELSPLADQQAPIHSEKMYDNMMNTYIYGKMYQECVLNDYYTRRHTSQYRQQFEALGEDFLRQSEEALEIQKRGQNYIDMVTASGQVLEAKRMQNIFDNVDKIVKESRQKAINLIEHSLKVMPVSRVIDHGEPNTSNDIYTMNQLQFRAYSDGSLHNYVGILFRAGAKDKANKLGLELAKQLESIIVYFTKSHPAIAMDSDNNKDLFAAMDSYFKLSMDALNQETGDVNGALASRLKNHLDGWYKNDFPAMYAKMKDLAAENGESIRRSSNAGKYSYMLFQTQDQLEAMAVHYGLAKDPGANKAPQATPNLEQIMNGQ